MLLRANASHVLFLLDSRGSFCSTTIDSGSVLSSVRCNKGSIAWAIAADGFVGFLSNAFRRRALDTRSEATGGRL